MSIDNQLELRDLGSNPCGSLYENDLYRLIYLNASWLLGRIGGCVFVGGSMSMEVAFGFSKVHTRSSVALCLLPEDQDINLLVISPGP